MRQGWREWVTRGLGLVVLLLAFGLPSAWALTVQVVGGPGSGTPDAFAQQLQQLLGNTATVQTTPQAHEPDLLVALTAEAYTAVRGRRQPVLVLVPEPDAVKVDDNDSALFWAPSLSEQLRLTRLLFPGVKRVGMLANEDSPRLKVFRQAAAGQGIEVLSRTAPADRLAREISELATRVDVLLAQQDSDLYNRDTIKTILLSAYRQNRVLIGPGPAFVRAGALASLYASPADLASAVAERIRLFARDGRLPAPGRISRFEVMLNAQVARALGLSLPDEAELARRLRAEEPIPWP